MNKLVMYGAGFLVSIGLALPALAAQPPVPTEPIRMELTSKPVIFNHATHADIACGDCHHMVNGEETYQKCATSGCHDILGQKEKSVNSYYRIAHDRKTAEINSCVKCHVEVAKAQPDKKKELTSCVGSSCHPKS